MTQEFVTYEQAVALKKLGFNEPCFATWVGETLDMSLQIPSNDYFTQAPTFSQAFRWLREKYGLYSWITIELGNKSTFCWVLSGEHTSTQYAAYFHTYEEAEFACLNKLIELLKL